MSATRRIRAAATVAFFVGLSALSVHFLGSSRGNDFYFGALSALVLAGYGWVSLRRA